MPLDPRIQFIDETARLQTLLAISTKRDRAHADRMVTVLAEQVQALCPHVPRGLIGPGLVCRPCVADFIVTGEAATASGTILADLHREEDARAGSTVVDFGETWWVPKSGPFATCAGDAGIFVKVVGVRSDVRVQLGVVTRPVEAPDPADEGTYVLLGWLLEHGRRAS